MQRSSSEDSTNPMAWVDHAKADLILASMEPPSGVFLELLCYHAQQAAEKALKAVVLGYSDLTVPRTHDIARLVAMIRDLGLSPPFGSEGAESLTQYATVTRYPADLGEVDEAEWQQAVGDARAVVEWAETQIGSA